jgi:two-component system sensor histidine kinase RegB
MPSLGFAQDHPRRNVRLDTLVRLRWLAVIGQTTAVLVVNYGLDFTLPIWACLSVIALSAWLNVALRLRFHMTQRLEPDRAAWLLAFDIAELAVLLYLTGGLQNPFAFLFLGPVLLSATALPPRFTLMLGAFAVACATVLVFAHYPLPWDSDDPLQLPPIYMIGVWLSILLAIGFIGVYAWQITEESRQLADALAATELVLAREQHLSQLDGLAAAAAHELGTPLSTISVIAKELENAIAAGAPHGDDVRLLREQATRCRDILAKLTELSSSGEPFDRTPLAALIEEVVAPHRNFGVAIEVSGPGARGAEPVNARNPAILYGLGNLVENAVDFAGESVTVGTQWNGDIVEVTIGDDGPGLRAGNYGPHRRALCHQPQAQPERLRRDSGRTGLGTFHRQDPARTLGRHARLWEPFDSGTRRRRHGALEPERFRAAVNVPAVLRSRRLYLFLGCVYTAARAKLCSAKV